MTFVDVSLFSEFLVCFIQPQTMNQIAIYKDNQSA